MGIDIHGLMLHNMSMRLLIILPLLLSFLSACVPSSTRDDDTQTNAEIKKSEENALLLFQSGNYYEAATEYLAIMDEYVDLNYGQSKKLERIIKQFIRNGEDKGLDEEVLVDILMNRLKNTNTNTNTMQNGGNNGNINIYSISFTNLKYNSIYLFSKLNFIGPRMYSY